MNDSLSMINRPAGLIGQGRPPYPRVPCQPVVVPGPDARIRAARRHSED